METETDVQFGQVARGFGSYLRLIDSCITQLKAQGPSRTCNESNEEEEEGISYSTIERFGTLDESASQGQILAMASPIFQVKVLRVQSGLSKYLIFLKWTS